MALPVPGVYRIKSALDESYYLDIGDGSTANLAYIYTRPWNGNREQIFVMTSYGEYVSLAATHSGKAIAVPETMGKTVNMVIQFDVIGANHGQRWGLTETTSSSGKTCYKLRNLFTSENSYPNIAIDSKQGLQKHVELAPLRESDAQKWIFEKYIYLNKSLPVPSSVGFATGSSSDITSRTVYLLSSSESAPTLYPIWACNGSQWQLRYRERTFSTGASSWGGWTAWKTLSGLTTEDGWGDIWKVNCEASGSGVTKKATTGIKVSIDPATVDQKQYQIEVRNCTTRNATIRNALEAGVSATGTVTVLYRPTLTLNSLTFTGDGLSIAYTSDYKRDGNTIYIGKIGTSKPVLGTAGAGTYRLLTTRNMRFDNMPHTGTINIPFSELTYLPDSGDEFNIVSTIVSGVNSAAREESKRTTMKLTYDTLHGINVDATFQYNLSSDAGAVQISRRANYPNSECHMIYEQDGETIITECEVTVDNRFIAVPPFNKEYTIIMSAVDKTNDNIWGAKSWKPKIISDKDGIVRGHMFTFASEDNNGDQILGNIDYFSLFLNDKPYSMESSSYSPDSVSYMFQGDRRESVYFGAGSSVSITVEGICPTAEGVKQFKRNDHLAKCTLDDFHRLRNHKYAVYRDPYGRRYEVAIIDTSETPLLNGFYKVSLTLKEVNGDYGD